MSEKESRTPYLDKVVAEYLSGVEKYFPGLNFSSRNSFYGGDQPYSCKLQFGFSSRMLRSTSYASPKKVAFIHYTSSLQSLFEILNGGYLRLTNLRALNDPQELSFLTNNLGFELTPVQLGEYKSHYFSASFCRILNDSQPDSFPMWRLYGGDGFGAGIVFEFVNPISDWHKFIFAQVQYGNNKSVDRFREFLSFHHAFQTKYNNPLQNWPSSLIAFLALHKNEIWSHEQELRLLTYLPFDKYSKEVYPFEKQMCNLKHSISSSGKPYSYVELPLFESKEFKRLRDREKAIGYEGHVNKSLPILRIKKIILGYRLEGNRFFDACDNIEYISREDYKYNFEVSDSHLRKYM